MICNSPVELDECAVRAKELGAKNIRSWPGARFSAPKPPLKTILQIRF